MAKRASKSTPPVVATESFASRRSLRERGVVAISLKTTDGLFFSLYLSRVPCIGEEVFCEGEVYLITRVQHDWLDEDGRAMVGNHAYLTGSWIPDEDDGIKVQRTVKKRRRKAAKKPRL